MSQRSMPSTDPVRGPEGRFSTRASVRRLLATSLIGWGLFGSPAVTAQPPWWLDTLDYSQEQLSPVRIGPGRLPYVDVRIDDVSLQLLFDTGNMTGLTLETHQYERLGLPEVGSVRRRDSSGRLIGEFRSGTARRVEALGRSVSDVVIHEFRHPWLPGLLGPVDLPGSRFTLDYQTAVIAVADTPLPATAIDRHALRLIRSPRHPRLIVVEGEFRGQVVLIEMDTGKTRTVVDPAWADTMNLTVVGADTVAVGDLRVGPAHFHVNDAKPLSLAAIDPELPAPLVLSLGSDMLSRFVVTIDYATGSALLWEVPR